MYSVRLLQKSGLLLKPPLLRYEDKPKDLQFRYNLTARTCRKFSAFCYCNIVVVHYQELFTFLSPFCCCCLGRDPRPFCRVRFGCKWSRLALQLLGIQKSASGPVIAVGNWKTDRMDFYLLIELSLTGCVVLWTSVAPRRGNQLRWVNSVFHYQLKRLPLFSSGIANRRAGAENRWENGLEH